ncbi:MAG: PUA domain-containing protein [archaeon]
MHRKQLSKKEIKLLNEQIETELGKSGHFDKKDHVEELDGRFIKRGDTIEFFIHEGRLLPTLRFLLQNPTLKTVVVDMGAVKFVASGADIMRPGIVEIDDDIKEGLAVRIIDVDNRKPLAVGLAMASSEDMKEMTSGKAVKSIHHVGDDIWKICS